MATIDLHCHPALNSWLFNSNFENDHPTLSKDFFPFQMTVDYPKMVRGEVDAILSSIYLPEAPLLEEADPSGLMRKTLNIFFHALHKAEINDTPDTPFEQTLAYLKHFENKISLAQDKNCAVSLARNFSELTSLLQTGTKAVIHSVEGAHSLGRKTAGMTPNYIDNIDTFFEKGVCLLTLAHVYENDIAAPVVGIPPSLIKKLKLSGERDLSRGLTAIGEEVVEHMLDIGMIVDLTHCTKIGRDKVFEINDRRGSHKRPLVFSHVGIADVFDHPMNPTASEIIKLKECGGTVGIIFDNYWVTGKEEDDPFPNFIDFSPEPGIDHILDTIDAIHAITGAYDTVSIGSDLDGFSDPPDDLHNASRFNFLKCKLVERYGNDAAKKILGENALRVLKLGWGDNT